MTQKKTLPDASGPGAPADHRHRVAAERRERMRGRLLRSALLLATVKGPTAMSIDDVIVDAQVSRGTFYKYFSSADELVRALAAALAGELIRIAEPFVRPHADPMERIARGIRVVSRFALMHPPVAEFLVRLGWPGDDSPNMLEFVRRDIEEGFRLACFTPMPMSMALNIVAGAVFGAMRRILEPDCAEDISEQAPAVALRALGARHEDADRLSRAPLDMAGVSFAGGFTEVLIAGNRSGDAAAR